MRFAVRIDPALDHEQVREDAMARSVLQPQGMKSIQRVKSVLFALATFGMMYVAPCVGGDYGS
jgi:hypothetical protein